MEFSSLFVIAAVPLICVAYFALSFALNRKSTAQRDSASSLVVLSGMVAALAILIPLGATLLPEKHLSWPGWLLVGALMASVLSLFGTVFSMISLQGKAQFAISAFPYIPCWINAAWFALALLALACVIVKVAPGQIREGGGSFGQKTQARFAIVHQLPLLGSSRQDVESEWGRPTWNKDSGFSYETPNGAIVFCVNSSGITQLIIETDEEGDNAITKYCK